MMVLKDKYHNGYTVLRLIATLNLHQMLMNPMMDTIVTNLWEGPYTIKSYFFLDYDVTY